MEKTAVESREEHDAERCPNSRIEMETYRKMEGGIARRRSARCLYHGSHSAVTRVGSVQRCPMVMGRGEAGRLGENLLTVEYDKNGWNSVLNLGRVEGIRPFLRIYSSERSTGFQLG